MSAAADSVNNPVRMANVGMVDMRGEGRAVGGSFLYEGDGLVTSWHSHDLHEIQYAARGVIEVETATGHYLLPPHQAAWIPAGMQHQTTIKTSVRNVAVLFEPRILPLPDDRVRILAVPGLLREMVLYALRWPIGRLGPDPVADDYFQTLAHLVAEALDHETPLSLPASSEPIVAEAVAYTQAHLESISAAQVAGAVGVSERSLRRQFHSSLGISWRNYLQRARLLRAMALLAEPGPSVLEVSLEVGFQDASAFARSFARHCGETPSEYRRRITSPPS